MTMQEINERAKRVESEYKKWEEKFKIPFEQKFNVTTLLSLRDQFLSTEDEHTKRKQDLLNMIQRLEGTLRLKPKIKNENINTNNKMLLVDHDIVVSFTNNNFKVKLYELDLSEGKLKSLSLELKNETLNEIAHKILKIVNNNKYNRVIFETSGIGYVLQNRFNSLANIE